MRNLWNRARQLVRRPRRGAERLYVSLDRLPDDTHYKSVEREVGGAYADHVLRLLHGDEERAIGRSRSRYPRSPWSRSVAGSIPRPSDASLRWTVTYDSTARYSDCE